MALYAFDGTWNEDKEGTEHDTNVRWFHDAYQKNKFYESGVGTRFGWLGKALGGVAGFGGRTRVKDALSALKKNYEQGDKEIHIVGFSRGAALALHFANRVANGNGVPLNTPIQFLGLWDTVPSFGIPGNMVDLGWDLDVPESVEHCYHAMALDECRHNFGIRRQPKGEKDTKNKSVVEVWFRGVHSDVGGGNGNLGLNMVTLCWMFENARRHGIDINPAVITQVQAARKPDVSIKLPFDIVAGPFRKFRDGDVVHDSVTSRTTAGKLRYNNPLEQMVRVTDTGEIAGPFSSTAHA